MSTENHKGQKTLRKIQKGSYLGLIIDFQTSAGVECRHFGNVIVFAFTLLFL